MWGAGPGKHSKQAWWIIDINMHFVLCMCYVQSLPDRLSHHIIMWGGRYGPFCGDIEIYLDLSKPVHIWQVWMHFIMLCGDLNVQNH